MAEGVWEAIRKLFACLWVPEYKSKCHKSKCQGCAVQVMEVAASSSLGIQLSSLKSSLKIGCIFLYIWLSCLELFCLLPAVQFSQRAITILFFFPFKLPDSPPRSRAVDHKAFLQALVPAVCCWRCSSLSPTGCDAAERGVEIQHDFFLRPTLFLVPEPPVPT